tara:strand:+ start:22548 stop:23213 length:666 start_codon:yes stop_codon:yes gene_type:complete
LVIKETCIIYGDKVKKVFIDCGSYDGCSVRKFSDLYDKKADYQYHCFEGNPLLANYHPVNERCVFHNTIVLDTEDEVTFYVHSTTGGSTISQQKNQRYKNKDESKYGDTEEIVLRPIRLSSYISDNFSPDDNIILKMDIEGAEYCVLRDLIKCDVLWYIDKIYIEWHINDRTEEPQPEEFISEFVEICDENDICLDTSWDSMHEPYMKEERNSEYKKKRKK